MQFKLTPNQLENFLIKIKHPPQFQKETGQFFYVQQPSGVEIATFLRIIEKGDLLQIISFIPIKSKQETVNELARLLHKINRDIDFPGFGLDEAAGLVFYRIVVPCLHQQCDGDLLEKHLHAIPKIITTFHKMIIAVILGDITYDELIKQSTPPPKE